MPPPQRGREILAGPGADLDPGTDRAYPVAVSSGVNDVPWYTVMQGSWHWTASNTNPCTRGLLLFHAAITGRFRTVIIICPDRYLQSPAGPVPPHPARHPRQPAQRVSLNLSSGRLAAQTRMKEAQKLRPLPEPGEGHPAVHHEPVRWPEGAAVRGRSQRQRLGDRR
jgi:hypothetical protein